MHTGQGTYQVNPVTTAPSNGFTATNRHPFLNSPGLVPTARGCWPAGPWMAADRTRSSGITCRARPPSGTVRCWVLAHTSTTPTPSSCRRGSTSNRSARAGTLNLNGVEYDSCPLYLIGQFTPAPSAALPPPLDTGASPMWARMPLSSGLHPRLSSGLDAGLDEAAVRRVERGRGQVHGRLRVRRQLALHVFRPGTQSRTGGSSFWDGLDAAAQNFSPAVLGTFGARYRVQGVKSTVCDRTKGATDTVAAVTTQAVGLLGNHVVFAGGTTSTTLTGAGKMSGRVLWDPAKRARGRHPVAGC